MTDELKQKLKDINLSYLVEAQGLSDSDIEQITQAFVEDGWIPYKPYSEIPVNQKPAEWWSKTPAIMTGEEFFAKLEQVLPSTVELVDLAHTHNFGVMRDAVLDAARKAAGIDAKLNK